MAAGTRGGGRAGTQDKGGVLTPAPSGPRAAVAGSREIRSRRPRAVQYGVSVVCRQSRSQLATAGLASKRRLRYADDRRTRRGRRRRVQRRQTVAP